ncbi:unnamed protein product [Ectocarpus sp. CCAP 1310/34]|nr:unnamed protein product [Ectocarpus sp. CCAP 1310/34]
MITTQPTDKLVAAHTNESRGIATTTVPWRRNTGGKSGKCPERSCGFSHTQRADTMPEGASAGPADASQASQVSQASAGGSSSADQGAAAADPKATGEAIDEMLAANDPVKNSNGKRAYPEPNFPIERSGAVGGKGSYPIRFKLNAAPTHGRSARATVPRKRIIEWLKQEEQLREKVSANPKLSKAKQVHSGGKASTVDAEQALVDYINEQRKQHRGCGNREVMNKVLELKPDALGGMPANAKPEEALAFKVKFNSWYQRFRKRHGSSIRRRTSVGQKLPKGYEGMAWATVMKLREALVKRAGEIYARRHPPAPDESPTKGEDLTSEQLASVEAEVFEELGNMDQTPVQHEMPVETTLDKTGAKDARISTGVEGGKIFLSIFGVIKGLLRGKHTAYSASAVADARSGKVKPPEREVVSTWCKESWESITPETVKTCFKICGLTLALDGSEDHAWCEHNFGEDYPDLLEEQHAVWLAEHPDVTPPPLKLPKVPGGFDSNPITAAQKEVEGKLLPYVADESDSDV